MMPAFADGGRRYHVAIVAACPFPTLQGSQLLVRRLAHGLRARGHKDAPVLDELGRRGAPQIGACGTGLSTAIWLGQDMADMDEIVHLRGHPLPRSDMGPLIGHE